MRGHLISIWFFIGVILLMYGGLILASGIYGLFHPPDVVLSRLHADLWWGMLLLVLGGIYAYRFRPGRE